jgi:peptidoglycan/LPS O-acetylase OafA/YrhL
LAELFFLSNIVLLNETGYFDIAADQKPLLHLWSLGVEEQFYIFWPLVAWLIFRGRHRRRHLLGAACILTLGSCALNIILSYLYAAAAFYLPITRIWEILTGAVLAILPSEKVSLASLRLRNILQPRLPTLGRYLDKVGSLSSAAEFLPLVGIGLIFISLPSSVGMMSSQVGARSFPCWERCYWYRDNIPGPIAR